MHDHKLYTVQCFDMLQSVFSLILPCLVQALVKSPTSLWKHSSSLAEAVSWESGNGATGNQGVRSRRSNQPTWNCLRLRCHQSKHLKLWFFVCQLYLASSSHIYSQCHSTSSDHLKLEGSEPLRPGDSLCHAKFGGLPDGESSPWMSGRFGCFVSRWRDAPNYGRILVEWGWARINYRNLVFRFLRPPYGCKACSTWGLQNCWMIPVC
jgi:hypothetical protein